MIETWGFREDIKDIDADDDDNNNADNTNDANDKDNKDGNNDKGISALTHGQNLGILLQDFSI